MPARASGDATLYLSATSMAADAAPGGPIETLLQQGPVVFAAKLRGLGSA